MIAFLIWFKKIKRKIFCLNRNKIQFNKCLKLFLILKANKIYLNNQINLNKPPKIPHKNYRIIFGKNDFDELAWLLLAINHVKKLIKINEAILNCINI